MTSLLKPTEQAFTGPNAWMRSRAKAAHIAALLWPHGREPPRRR
jgi:hypothetical protein